MSSKAKALKTYPWHRGEHSYAEWEKLKAFLRDTVLNVTNPAPELSTSKLAELAKVGAQVRCVASAIAEAARAIGLGVKDGTIVIPQKKNGGGVTRYARECGDGHQKFNRVADRAGGSLAQGAGRNRADLRVAHQIDSRGVSVQERPDSSAACSAA